MYVHIIHEEIRVLVVASMLKEHNIKYTYPNAFRHDPNHGMGNIWTLYCSMVVLIVMVMLKFSSLTFKPMVLSII